MSIIRPAVLAASASIALAIYVLLYAPEDLRGTAGIPLLLAIWIFIQYPPPGDGVGQKAGALPGLKFLGTDKKTPLGEATGKKPVPEGLWVRCPSCSSSLFRRSLENNLSVCPDCEHHFRLSGIQRVEQLSDPGTFVPMDAELVSTDPLEFVDIKAYPDRIAAARKKTGRDDAMAIGVGRIGGVESVVLVQNFAFMGGSLGMAAGESFIKAAEEAIARKAPLIVYTAAGGARMQEGTLSLMQMPRTTLAIDEVREAVLRGVARGEERRALRSEMLRWHPDKFGARLGRSVRAEDRERTVVRVNAVARMVAELFKRAG